MGGNGGGGGLCISTAFVPQSLALGNADPLPPPFLPPPLLLAGALHNLSGRTGGTRFSKVLCVVASYSILALCSDFSRVSQGQRPLYGSRVQREALLLWLRGRIMRKRVCVCVYIHVYICRNVT